MSERAISALKLLVGTPPAPITGTVKAVDVQAGTCDVEPNDGGADVLGARLRAVLDNTTAGLLLVPAVGADVLLVPLDAHSYAVVLASELTEVRATIGQMQLVMDATGVRFTTGQLGGVKLAGDGLTLNDGQHGGLVLITPLVTLLNQMITQGNAMATTLTTILGTPYPQVPPASAPALSNPSITQ